MTITIRPLTREDHADWSCLWQAYLTFYETTLPDTTTDVLFERLLGDDSRDFTCLLAVADHRPVGLVHYVFHRNSWVTEEVCYLQDLYVAPETRGTGAGRSLIQAVYDAADAQNAASVYWMTQEYNSTARHLYDRVANVTPFIKYKR